MCIKPLSIPNETIKLFKEFDQDYLADVLSIWDCDTQNWFGSCITVFRFENDDLLIWNEIGSLKAKKGPVDTSKLDYSCFQELRKAFFKRACLCWRANSIFGNYLGKTGLELKLLDTLYLDYKDLRMRLSARLPHY